MSTHIRTKRLLRELRELKRSPSAHILLGDTDSIDKWTVCLRGVEGTLYEDEKFTLTFDFPAEYPLEAPIVVFSGKTPIHPHVYSNGHICLSILYKHWCPVLTVDAICQSLLSMLSSCEKKKRPHQDSVYVKQASESPKDTLWLFDALF
ncbi:putative ubiquitin-conjugating enzyme E2 W [Coemansia reversa NRRL 1564]|uniref:Putative ubiquitin-conjugating enzyme E2 W n=1 Tax=Coemansia reversa (strain ATCC 12441 / NRRL 1564) TaxID=763665 RepID=A0A2G5B3T3_COERN|nr:putative ubiquitin-conjugating enzyme E2 W [Coemansia reversa NRRL 1564]|eukprot:PIA13679.1 putative ubiquitin-conjugating enzyme E2 W [Coemansia reversa NRRL 1564]